LIFSFDTSTQLSIDPEPFGSELVAELPVQYGTGHGLGAHSERSEEWEGGLPV